MFRSLLFTLITFSLVLAFTSVDAADLNSVQTKPKIAIVIDDLGDNPVIGRKIVNLPVALTLAILPKTPQAKYIAEKGFTQGHEIIMHLPMEAFTRPDLLGPGALYANMSDEDFNKTLSENIESIPHLVGFNNHMGSMLTENTEKMNLLMSLAKNKNWYFLDSKTSELSVAEKIAKDNGLPTIGRDIFLDHYSKTQRLDKVLPERLKQAKKIARLKGYAVVLCHPYPETYQFLSQELDSLKSEFELVKLSDLIDRKTEYSQR